MINNLAFLHTPFSLGLKTFRAEKAKKGVLTYCFHTVSILFPPCRCYSSGLKRRDFHTGLTHRFPSDGRCRPRLRRTAIRGVRKGDPSRTGPRRSGSRPSTRQTPRPTTVRRVGETPVASDRLNVSRPPPADQYLRIKSRTFFQRRSRSRTRSHARRHSDEQKCCKGLRRGLRHGSGKWSCSGYAAAAARRTHPWLRTCAETSERRSSHSLYACNTRLRALLNKAGSPASAVASSTATE